MRRAVLAAALLAASSCCAQPLAPEPLLPSPERLRELARIPVESAPVESLPFRITVRPAIILAGGAAWVTCFVPRDVTAHDIRWGVEGITMSTRPADRVENKRLIERIPCGTWQAVCSLSDGRRLVSPLEARGECNAGDDR